jgi:hypothetical protein
MFTVGVDYQPSDPYIAFGDTETEGYLDELKSERLNIPQLRDTRKKFPRPVVETILPTVLEKCIPSRSVLPKI